MDKHTHTHKHRWVNVLLPLTFGTNNTVLKYSENEIFWNMVIKVLVKMSPWEMLLKWILE